MPPFSKLVLSIICCLCCTKAYSCETPLVEQVVTNHQGVSLLIGETWLVTKGMQASDEGMFVLVGGAWMPLSEAVEIGEYQASWKCTQCGRYNMDGINACPYCGKSKND